MSASDTSPPLRTVVVGLGRIGHGFHVPCIRGDKRFRLVGVSDPLLDRRTEATALWDVPAYANLPELLSEARPDLVVLATPTPFHAAQSKLAFAAHAHVFCEKPVASSVAELDEMIQHAALADRKLVPYQPRRYAQDVQAIRQLLESRRLGRVHLIRRSRCNFERRRDWQAFRANGGGMLNNYGSHCLDELLSLLPGEMIASVYCQLRSAATLGDAEDVVLAILTTTSGMMIDLHISQAAALSSPAWEIFGDQGAAQFDEGSQVLNVRFFSADAAPKPLPDKSFAAEGRLYRTEELPWQTLQHDVTHLRSHDYYDALWRHLVLDEPSPVSLADARTLLALIDRCRVSSISGERT